MGKKKDKSKKGKGAEKTALKTEKKADRKVKKMLKAKGEENIEALLAEYQEQGKKQLQVVEERCEQPSPRSNSTLTPHPEKEELILFGGELFNGNKTVMYNDMFMYSIKHNTWTLLKVPGAPQPRSSHQVVPVKQAGGQLWLFGGEFASPSQSQFLHYKDLWVFHFHSNKWEKVSVPGGPSARSGHRMAVCKRQILIFGGFHDNLRGDCKYFNDVHVFELDTYTWTQLQPSGFAPPPRSGCCLAVAQDEKSVVVFGGYSKKPIKKDVDKGTVHTDMYTLSMDGKSADAKYKWTQVKQSGVRPSPRCSCSVVATPGNRALSFGGVVDDEDDEEMESKFYNDMFTVELDRGKWHQVTLREKKEPKDKKRRRRKKDEKNEAGSDNDQCDTDDDIEDDVERLTMMENSTSGVESSTIAHQSATGSNACDAQSDSKDSIFTVSIGAQSSQAQHASAQSLNVTSHGDSKFWPCARMNAQLAVRSGVLYLYGGLYEEGDKQVTLQDMYALDLHKLDEWKTLIKNQAHELVWEASDSSESDVSDDDDDDSDDDDDQDMETDDSPPPLNKEETVNDYFSRAKDYWLDKADELAEKEGLTVSMKQLKKAAFKMAEEFVEQLAAKS